VDQRFGVKRGVVPGANLPLSGRGQGVRAEGKTIDAIDDCTIISSCRLSAGRICCFSCNGRLNLYQHRNYAKNRYAIPRFAAVDLFGRFVGTAVPGWADLPERNDFRSMPYSSLTNSPEWLGSSSPIETDSADLERLRVEAMNGDATARSII